MIRILNADKTDQIIKYFKEQKDNVFISNSLEYTLFNKPDALRNMIFNGYIMPIALMHENIILSLTLFNVESLNESSRNIQLLGGDIDKKFLKFSIAKIKEFLDELMICKVTVRADINDFEKCTKNFENQGYINELDIVIGSHRFIQKSIFLNKADNCFVRNENELLSVD